MSDHDYYTKLHPYAPLADSLRSIQRQLLALNTQVVLLQYADPEDTIHLAKIEEAAALLNYDLAKTTDLYAPGWEQWTLPPTEEP